MNLKLLTRSRNHLICRAAVPAAVLMAAIFVSFRASAALGGDLTSVDADQKQIQAIKRTARVSGSYTAHELRTGYGMAIRQYVSPAGKVFGVAWDGLQIPDLRQILGNYYDQFERAAAQRRLVHQRGPLVIEEPGLVVYSGGHMRAYTGKAYSPDELPQGVRPEEIR
jgi:hypothetical protein